MNTLPTTLPTELFYMLGTAVIALGALTWRTLLVRVRELETKQNSMPFHVLAEDVAVIKRDIEWIKNLFKDRQR